MSMKSINKLVLGLAPVADAFDTSAETDVVSMRNYGAVEFVIIKAVGATGTDTVTVLACSDVSSSATSAVAFKYQAITSGDTPGAITDATAAGFATTAGSNQMYRIFVDASVLASSGYEFVKCVTTELVNSPVLGGILTIMKEPRSDAEIPATAIV